MKKKRTPLSYLLPMCRKIFRWMPEFRQVKGRCKLNDKYVCEKCKKVVENVQVDHRMPIGVQPKVIDDFVPWFKKLFCPIENLWGLCVECHKTKSAKEAKIRASNRKAKVTEQDMDNWASRLPEKDK